MEISQLKSGGFRMSDILNLGKKDKQQTYELREGFCYLSVATFRDLSSVSSTHSRFS